MKVLPRSLARLVTTIVAASIMTAIGISSSSADEATDKVRREQAHAHAQAQSPALSADRHVSHGSLPITRTTQRGISIEWPDGRSSGIYLPTSKGSSRSASQVSGGDVVYLDAESGGHSYVVQEGGGSTRVVAVISSAAERHQLDFGLAGFTPHVQDDGGAVFVADDGFAVGVAAPWARDASGALVRTRYRVSGHRLVQEIQPGAATRYPIVADPQWMWWSAAYGLKFSRTETSNMRDWSVAAGMCAVFIRTPATAGVCAAWVSYAVFQAVLAEQDNPRRCLFAQVVPVPGPIWRIYC